MDAAKPLPSTAGDLGAAPTHAPRSDEMAAVVNRATGAVSVTAAGGPTAVRAVVTTGDVETVRAQFRDAIDKAITLVDVGDHESDLATRFGAMQQARNRVWLARLAYEDVRQRFEWQERKAAAEATRRLASTAAELAERQAFYARNNFVLAVIVTIAMLAQSAVVAILAWRWRWR